MFRSFFNFSTFIVPSVSSALILQWHSRGTKSETWQNHRLCPKYPRLKPQLLQVHMISVFMPFSQVHFQDSWPWISAALERKIWIVHIKAAGQAFKYPASSRVLHWLWHSTWVTIHVYHPQNKSSSWQNISPSHKENCVKQTKSQKTNQQLQECGNSNPFKAFHLRIFVEPIKTHRSQLLLKKTPEADIALISTDLAGFGIRWVPERNLIYPLKW